MLIHVHEIKFVLKKNLIVGSCLLIFFSPNLNGLANRCLHGGGEWPMRGRDLRANERRLCSPGTSFAPQENHTLTTANSTIQSSLQYPTITTITTTINKYHYAQKIALTQLKHSQNNHKQQLPKSHRHNQYVAIPYRNHRWWWELL